MCGAVGCGSREEPVAPDPFASLPVVPEHSARVDEAAARALPIAELRTLATTEAREAEALGPTADGVEALRHAAMLARVCADRGDTEAIERARSLLSEASRRRSLAGACEAALELATLEEGAAHDAQAAYVVLYRTTRRFTTGEHAECARTAASRLEALGGSTPPRAQLAVIDADPDADDPSVGLGAPAPSVPLGDAEASLAAWARERSAAAASRLEALSVVSPPGATSVRVVLSFDHVAVFDRRDLPAEGALPRRLVLELASTTVAEGVPDVAPVDTAGLVRVRTIRDASGARVTLDLAENADAHLFLLPEPYRILIDVSQQAADAPLTTAEHPPVRLVVLDPGHGGDDYGARAFRLHEADLTLDLALRTRDALARRRPDIRVVLTRENDTFVSLEQRTAMANAVGADLFVSIHLNAAWEPVDHGGVTTFVLDTTDDRQLVRLAARENGTSTSEVTELERILAGIHREGQGAASRALAERIHRGTLASGRRILPHLHDRGVRSAMFYVLVGATMPAVLVETSFLTREDEADALRTERYRDALASGIAEGIARYAAPP